MDKRLLRKTFIEHNNTELHSQMASPVFLILPRGWVWDEPSHTGIVFCIQMNQDSWYFLEKLAFCAQDQIHTETIQIIKARSCERIGCQRPWLSSFTLLWQGHLCTVQLHNVKPHSAHTQRRLMKKRVQFCTGLVYLYSRSAPSREWKTRSQEEWDQIKTETHSSLIHLASQMPVCAAGLKGRNGEINIWYFTFMLSGKT